VGCWQACEDRSAFETVRTQSLGELKRVAHVERHPAVVREKSSPTRERISSASARFRADGCDPLAGSALDR
jgi:hypothetical protein